MTQTKSANERFKSVEEESSKLAELRAKRQSLTGEMYNDLESANKMYEKYDSGTLAETQGELSKLEEGLNQYGDFKETIGEMAQGLSATLDEYVAFTAESQNYQGMKEKALSFFGMKGRANRLRNDRLRNQNPKENLQMVLDYGEQLVSELTSIRSDAIQTYERLETSVSIITSKIEEFQPKEESMKEKLDALKSQYADLEEKAATATPAEQAKFQVEMDKLHKTVVETQNEYNDVFTIYDRAQQSLAANIKSRDSFQKMIEDIGIQARHIKEDVDNLTEIYLSAPEAVKVMMVTKGTDVITDAMKISTQESLDIITKSAEAVSDATKLVQEKQVIEEDVMKGYIERVEQTLRDSEKRYAEIRKKSLRSQEERYQ